MPESAYLTLGAASLLEVFADLARSMFVVVVVGSLGVGVRTFVAILAVALLKKPAHRSGGLVGFGGGVMSESTVVALSALSVKEESTYPLPVRHILFTVVVIVIHSGHRVGDRLLLLELHHGWGVHMHWHSQLWSMGRHLLRIK